MRAASQEAAKNSAERIRRQEKGDKARAGDPSKKPKKIIKAGHKKMKADDKAAKAVKAAKAAEKARAAAYENYEKLVKPWGRVNGLIVKPPIYLCGIWYQPEPRPVQADLHRRSQRRQSPSGQGDVRATCHKIMSEGIPKTIIDAKAADENAERYTELSEVSERVQTLLQQYTGEKLELSAVREFMSTDQGCESVIRLLHLHSVQKRPLSMLEAIARGKRFAPGFSNNHLKDFYGPITHRNFGQKMANIMELVTSGKIQGLTFGKGGESEEMDEVENIFHDWPQCDTYTPIRPNNEKNLKLYRKGHLIPGSGKQTAHYYSYEINNYTKWYNKQPGERDSSTFEREQLERCDHPGNLHMAKIKSNTFVKGDDKSGLHRIIDRDFIDTHRLIQSGELGDHEYMKFCNFSRKQYEDRFVKQVESLERSGGLRDPDIQEFYQTVASAYSFDF